jgi:hypothetical protein
MSKSKKKNIKVRDLNPKKDAKGGSVQNTIKQQQGSSMTGSSMTGSTVQNTTKSIN